MGGGCSARAFSLVELVIVVVIIAVIAAIAIPRMSSASSGARDAALAENQRIFQSAIDQFAAEHGGLAPGDNGAGGTVTPLVLAARLLRPTDDGGAMGGDGYLGPYLREVPVNPYNDKSTVRIDGAAAGAGTAGWRYDSARAAVEADHQVSGGRPVVNLDSELIVDDGLVVKIIKAK